MVISLGLFVFVLSWPFTATRAGDDFANDQTAYLTTPSQPEQRNITVFGNALVDELFGKDRLTKQEDDKNRGESENAIAPSTPSTPIMRKDPPSLQPRVQPNESLMVGIARNTSAKRAAALRFAEKGRKLLRSGDYEKALVHLEKALALDPSPHIYFYLARAHYYLARYQQALNFLEIAEPWLTEQADWLAEVAALRAESFRASRQGTRYARVR
ncbi:MAG: tetratricopeptide repeat protein [Deltaproteobacteria bacterium]|nr:tetratricopeptide repeat protein [Deltaproteobacteria bacterium]